jgi:hypothetical protein
MLRPSDDVRLLEGSEGGAARSGGVTVSPRKEHVSPRHRHRTITEAGDSEEERALGHSADSSERVGGCATRCRSEFVPFGDVERRIDLAAVDEPVVEERQLPIVLVTWQDAWADSEQHELTEWRSDYLVRTTGFLVRDDPDVVSIAQEILPEADGFRAVTHIPRGMVERVTRLNPVGTATNGTH